MAPRLVLTLASYLLRFRMDPAAETASAGVQVKDDLSEKCQKLFVEFLEE